MSVARLIARLSALEAEWWPEQLADALWLASLQLFEPTTETETIGPVSVPDEDETSDDPGEDDDVTQEETDESAEPDDTIEPEPPTPGADVSVPASKHAGMSNRTGVRVSMPAARALPAGRLIARSLRPLRRSMPSYVEQVIDENATAENIAEQGIWCPTLRPARRRWLELALVLDDSRSMTLWRDTLEELRLLLAQTGAFRDIRVWWLDTSQPDRVALRAHPSEQQGSPDRAPGELLSPDGTRVILVASDCVAPAWDSSGVGRLLRTWGARQPVALLQLLPPQLWRRTALDPARGVRNVHAGANEPGVPNVHLHWRTWRARASSDAALDSNAPLAQRPSGVLVPTVAIPVVTAEPESLGPWAKLIRYGAQATVPAVIFPERVSVRHRGEKLTGTRIDPHDAIITFRAVSSRLAFRLAGLLSAAPLRLPVMRLVQGALLPESHQVHLAEVFLSGLIQSTGPIEGTDPDLVDYDFVPGVRDLLLNASRINEAIQVQRTVSTYLEERLGHAFDFDAILEAPEDFDDTIVNAENAPFARISAEVLKRLGRRYAVAAARMLGAAVRTAEPTSQLADKTVFANQRILLVSVGNTSMDREAIQLHDLGARVEHITISPEDLDLRHISMPGYDAIIADCNRIDGSMDGIKLLDMLQSHRNFTPVALFGRHAGDCRTQAADRYAVACSDEFPDILLALKNLFLKDPQERSRPTPHLPERCERELVRYLRDDFRIVRSAQDDLSADGSIVDDAEARWRDVWHSALNDSIDSRSRGSIVLHIASGCDSVQVWKDRAAFMESEDVRGLTKDELTQLNSRLDKELPFHLPDSHVRKRPARWQRRSLLVIPLVHTVRHEIVALSSERPFAFGERQVKWLTMLARSFTDSLLSGASLSPKSDFPSIAAALTRFPLRLQGVFLLRTALRLEGRSRQQQRSLTAEQRTCRKLVEYVEALLCFKHMDPYVSVNISEVFLPGHAPEGLADISDPVLRCVVIFALAAANSALFRAGTELKEDLRKCEQALRELSPEVIRRIPEQIVGDMARIRDPEHLSPIQLMDELGPLWPREVRDATGAVLPVNRRPTLFVLVAGGDYQQSLEPVAEALGRTLAAAGFGLITGTSLTVDETVARGFLRRLGTWGGVNPNQWFQQILDRGSRNIGNESANLIRCQTDLECLVSRFLRARAAVLLGGGPFTERIGRIALETHTLLLPLIDTGGAARTLFGEMIGRSNRLRQGSRELVAAANVAGDRPIDAVMAIPDAVRRFSNPKSRGRAQAAANDLTSAAECIVTLTVRVDSPRFPSTVTGCVLAHPRVVITRIPREGTPLPSAKNVSLRTEFGSLYSSRVLFSLSDSAGVTVVLEVPENFTARGLECIASFPVNRQRLRLAAEERLVGVGNPPPSSQMQFDFRDASPAVLPAVQPRLLSPAPDEPFQGAPLLDEEYRVRGLVELTGGSGSAQMIPTVNWYRRVLATYGALRVTES